MSITTVSIISQLSNLLEKVAIALIFLFAIISLIWGTYNIVGIGFAMLLLVIAFILDWIKNKKLPS